MTTDTPDPVADPVADTPVETPAETPVEDPVDPLVEATGSGPVLTLAQAVEACSVSKATLQRRLRSGAVPGAERTPAGSWAIPFSGLIAAGLAPAVSPPDARVEAGVDLSLEVEQLRASLRLVQAQRDHAVELAAVQAEQVRTLASLLDSLRPMLEAGVEVERRPRRRWFRRG